MKTLLRVAYICTNLVHPRIASGVRYYQLNIVEDKVLRAYKIFVYYIIGSTMKRLNYL